MKITAELMRSARKRLLQMHYDSRVGHIGGNLSAIDAMLVLFHEYLTEQDCFILSKGHSAGALYIALWSKGILTDEDLKSFHQDATKLPGHPPATGIPAIPFATGSLGHGLSLAAGTALAKRLKGSKGSVYCLTSDGEWQEGSTWEALIFASHHCLNNLTILVDLNHLQGFGSTAETASMDPLENKLKGFNVDILRISGHNPEAIRWALEKSTNQPKLLILETTKGRGVVFMENKMEWHYLPLAEQQYLQAIEEVTMS